MFTVLGRVLYYYFVLGPSESSSLLVTLYGKAT